MNFEAVVPPVEFSRPEVARLLIDAYRTIDAEQLITG